MTVRGGDKVKAALRKVLSRLESGEKLSVGFLEGATYPDGQSVAEVAAFNEYGHTVRGGSYYVLPRPFFRNMIAGKEKDWPKTFAALLKANDYDLTKVFHLMGSGIVGQLKESIRNTNSPPLAESTIRAKGFAKPLIDTSHMINSAEYEINL